MAVEIEKKYRLTSEELARLLPKLHEIGAEFISEEFETNTLFTNSDLRLKDSSILRLRVTENRAVLTYKESLPSDSGVKRRVEHETVVEDGGAMLKIIESLGYKPHLIYEKRRRTWHFDKAEITVDELPFGFYLEIEAAEPAILKAEEKLKITGLTVEQDSYPALAARFGTTHNTVIEARF